MNKQEIKLPVVASEDEAGQPGSGEAGRRETGNAEASGNVLGEAPPKASAKAPGSASAEWWPSKGGQLLRGLLAGALAVLIVLGAAVFLLFATSPQEGGIALTAADAQLASDTLYVPPTEPVIDYAALFVSPDPFARLRYDEAAGLTLIGAATADALSAQAREALLAETAAIEQSGHTVGYVLYDLTTGLGLAYNSDSAFYSASAIKGPYVASLVAAQPEVFIAEEAALLSVVANSDNTAYVELLTRYSSDCLRQWYINSDTELTDWNSWYPYITARDMARLWVSNQRFFTGDAPYAAELATFYTQPNNSVINAELGWRSVTFTKGGWWYPGADPGVTTGGDAGTTQTMDEAIAAAGTAYDTVSSANDAGIVVAGEDGSRPYILVVLSDYPASLTSLSGLVNCLDAAHEELAAFDLGLLYHRDTGQ
jgi:hypothetical protein